MTATHSFLTDLSPERRPGAVENLGAWRQQGILDRAMPGISIGGTPWQEVVNSTHIGTPVEMRPLFDQHGNPIGTHRATFREGSNHPLGVVSASYGVVQDREAFEGFGMLAAQGVVSPERLLIENGGARVTVSGIVGFSKIQRPRVEVGDVLAHMIQVSNGHTGMDAFTFEAFTLRLVCLNGMTSHTRSQSIRIKHTSNAASRVSVAQDAVVRLIAAEKAEADHLAEMAQQEMSASAFVEFSSMLLEGARGPADTDRKKERREKEIIDLLEFFEHGAGNHGLSHYDAYNAVTEWLTPRREAYREASEFARAYRAASTDGTAAKTRARAMRLLSR